MSMALWPVETAKNAWERVQHAEVCHVMHESMWRILLMLAGASMPCSLFTVSSANTRAGWPRGRCGRCAIMRLSRPLETRMTRLERPRRRRAERVHEDIARGPREVFSALEYSARNLSIQTTYDCGSAAFGSQATPLMALSLSA